MKHRTVILVSLFKASEVVIKNMLCHFDRLDIHNYILIGPKSDVLLDLARRGHPVIDADQLLNGIRAKLKGFQGLKPELIKEIMVEGHVIRKCLASKISTWVIDGNMLPNGSDMFTEVNDFSSDISATKDSEILFVKSSPAIGEIWTDIFINKVLTVADSLISRDSLSRDHQHFRYLMVKTFEEKGGSVKTVGQLSLGLNIGTNHANQTSIGDGTKMVFWPLKMNLDNIQNRLADLGMWVVDGETSCTAVVCHQS